MTRGYRITLDIALSTEVFIKDIKPGWAGGETKNRKD